MILPPFSAPQDFKAGLYSSVETEATWFIFFKDQLFIADDGKSLPSDHKFILQRTLYLGTLRNKNLFAGEIESENEIPEGWQLSCLKSLYSLLDEENYSIAGRALQLIHWDRTNEFCGCCGSATLPRKNERCRECKTCGLLAYPKQAPVVMFLIKRDDKILLARGPNFPGKFYSVLAGFLDPGETLEQCVAREALEEVGIKVANIQYFASQPWPFSHSIMIGFTCEWVEGEIQIDPLEIEKASWFNVLDLPELPSELSLAHILINSHLNKIK